MENGPGSLGLVEFSARTGRPLRVVIQPQTTDGAFCGTLWSDPSGQHLTAACTWDAHTGTVDNVEGCWHLLGMCDAQVTPDGGSSTTATGGTGWRGDRRLVTRARVLPNASAWCHSFPSR
jgi:hypothetical protein